MRALLPILILLAACREDATAALIEVQSDLGAELTRVEITVHDREQRQVLDRYSFDAERSSAYRVPFSFVLEPRSQPDQALVVTASGYGRSELLSEAKLRLSLVRGKTLRHSLWLWAACRGVPCAGGQACDPVTAQCGEIPAGSEQGGTTSGQAAGGKSGDRDGRAQPAGSGAGGDAAVAGAGAGHGGSAAPPSGGAGAASPSGGAGAAAPSGGAGAAAPSGGAGVAAPSGGAGTAAPRGGAGAAAPRGGAGGAGGSGGADGPLGPAADGGGGSGELSGTQTARVTYQGQGYVVSSNVYGGTMQTLRYQGTSFTILTQSGTGPDVVAFPAVYIGAQYGVESAGTNLPKRADAIGSIQVSMTTNADRVPGTYRALSALWLSAGPRFDTSLPTGGYLEVWHYVRTPQDPPGTRVVRDLSLEGAPGTYDVWQGTCSDRPCTMYVRKDPVTSFSGDLAPFLRDAMARPNGVDPSWYVNGVYCGFDIAAGGAGLQAQNISESVR